MMVPRGPLFSFDDWLLTTALVGVTAQRRARTAFYEKAELACATEGGATVSADFRWPESGVETITVRSSAGEARVPGHPAWETAEHRKEEEFARAVPLALFDYLRKSRARQLVVSLSGGADSSAGAGVGDPALRLGGHELG